MKRVRKSDHPAFLVWVRGEMGHRRDLLRLIAKADYERHVDVYLAALERIVAGDLSGWTWDSELPQEVVSLHSHSRLEGDSIDRDAHLVRLFACVVILYCEFDPRYGTCLDYADHALPAILESVATVFRPQLADASAFVEHLLAAHRSRRQERADDEDAAALEVARFLLLVERSAPIDDVAPALNRCSATSCLREAPWFTVDGQFKALTFQRHEYSAQWRRLFVRAASALRARRDGQVLASHLEILIGRPS